MPPPWKLQPRGPIELGADDICFDDFMSSLQRTSLRGSTRQMDSQQSSFSSDAAHRRVAGALEYSPVPAAEQRPQGPQTSNMRHQSAPSTQLQLEQLVFQHQSLIDQLLIELALERESRIALEDRVGLLEERLQHRTAAAQQEISVPVNGKKYSGNMAELGDLRSHAAQTLDTPTSKVHDGRVASLSLLRRQPTLQRADVVSPPRRGWSTITEESMHS
jgi:hypothetical protein